MENTNEIRIIEEDIRKIKKEIKVIEYDIASYNQEKELLIQKLDSLLVPEYQTQRIERYLVNKYHQNLGTYKIDRSKEPEIVELITAKEQRLKTILDAYKESIETNRKDEVKSKRIKKDTASELKKLFLELDVDLIRFYKAGISRVYFTETLDLMNRIKNNIEKCADFPVSYANKLYKLEIMLKDIPEDLEYQEKEKEAKSRLRLEKDRQNSENEIENIKKEINSLRRNKTRISSDLTSVVNEINLYENDDYAIDEIKKKLESTKAEYLTKLEKNKNHLALENNNTIKRINAVYAGMLNNLRKECEAEVSAKLDSVRDERITVSKEIDKIDDSIMLIDNQIRSALDNLEQLEDTFNSTSPLLFVKRKSLKDEISSLEVRIKNYEEEKGKQNHLKESKMDFLGLLQEDELTKKIENDYDLKIKQLEKEKSDRIKNKIEILNDEITKLDMVKENDFDLYETESKNRIENLGKERKELQCKKEALECEVNNLDLKIKNLKKSCDEEGENKKQIDTKLLNFHNAYLLKKYGKECGINDEIKSVRAKIAENEKNANSKSKLLSLAESELIVLNEKLKDLKMALNRENEIKTANEEKRKEWLLEESRKKENEQQILLVKESSDNLIQHLHSLAESLDLHRIENGQSPLSDVGKATITSNIVVRRLVQGVDLTKTNKYIAFFVDENNDIISDFRFVDRREEGYENKVSFELALKNNQYKGDAHILIVSYENLEIVGFLDYKINISFFDDFM